MGPDGAFRPHGLPWRRLSQSFLSPDKGATVGGRRMEFLLAYTSSKGLFLALVGIAVLVACWFKGLAAKE